MKFLVFASMENDAAKTIFAAMQIRVISALRNGTCNFLLQLICSFLLYRFLLESSALFWGLEEVVMINCEKLRKNKLEKNVHERSLTLSHFQLSIFSTI